ncbi:zinc finger protein 276 [Phyllopteryx taeniolatus]|uniref:zinc finger protein 276 n=1 Tax=Phyllopteryx taeniolatus TaxID=161469 RepID=UPI002AD3AE0E|nr:zinc finger protein 276 [Phyllopteryx taeniolatus]
MKRKGRCSRSSETSPSQKSARLCEGRRKTQRNIRVAAATSELYRGDAATDATSALADKQSKSSKLSTAICRLCHGKFSPRSLLHAFNKWPHDFPDLINEEAYAAAKSPSLFHVDFQRLVGVQLDPDSRLSEFVCKKCHSKFYKCHNILVRFLQMVNLLPVGKDNSKIRHKPMFSDSLINDGSTTSPSFSLDTASLHNLVSWAHHHGEACKSCPDLNPVLEGQCWGSVKAVWCCVDGHSYTMNTQGTTSVRFGYLLNPGESGNGAREISLEVACEERSTVGTPGCQAQQSPPAVTPLVQSPTLTDWTCDTKEFADPQVAISPVQEQQEDKQTNTDLSDRATGPNEQQQITNTSGDPKVKRKPGPKPGWKNKFKPKGEELPNIYKCLYQGCTAVYRAPDGLKKHIKEHHEEVRERPCPHPGCNKVFTIDRYLQRHVKLIHTGMFAFISQSLGLPSKVWTVVDSKLDIIHSKCYFFGSGTPTEPRAAPYHHRAPTIQFTQQTRTLKKKYMEDMGRKALNSFQGTTPSHWCEVCGFQCRQRASLKYHMTKHKAEADLDFACLVCSKRFEKAHNLNVHMSMVHPLTQTKIQKGGNKQKPHAAFSNLHNILMSGEAMPQEQDR